MTPEEKALREKKEWFHSQYPLLKLYAFPSVNNNNPVLLYLLEINRMILEELKKFNNHFGSIISKDKVPSSEEEGELLLSPSSDQKLKKIKRKRGQ